MWHVCLYLVDRAYGGPEEGGWYYNTGEAIPYGMDDRDATACQFFATLAEAKRHLRWMNDYALEGLNKGRPPIDSVNSQGVYQFKLGIGVPKDFPADKPRYE